MGEAMTTDDVRVELIDVQRQEIERLRDLIQSVNLCAKPANRDLNQLARDLHLIYDLTLPDKGRRR